MSGPERGIRDLVRDRTVMVVGVGNRLCGDDGAGPRVVDRLQELGCRQVLDAGAVPENYLAPLLAASPQVVLLVDAVDHGAPAGARCLVEPDALGIRMNTTHAPSLRLLAYLLETTGIECALLGIQPASMVPGEGLGPAVTAGAERAARAIAAALEFAAPARRVVRA